MAGPIAKMVNPTRITLILEQSHLDILTEAYGRKRLDVIRELIEAHIEELENIENVNSAAGSNIETWAKLAWAELAKR